MKIVSLKRIALYIFISIKDLDVLVNNAGATWGAPLDEYPDAAFQKVMNLNVTRIFTLTQA